MKIIGILALGTLPLLANAQGSSTGGNGGDAIVCGNQVTLLDAYEATERGWKIQLEGQTLREKVSSALNRLKKVESGRAKFLQEYADEMLDDLDRRAQGKETQVFHFTSSILADIPDSLETSIPAGCQKEQLVIQKSKKFPDEKRYTFQEMLWNKMGLNSDAQAMTILHEAWYRLTLSLGAVDSRAARYMNGYYSSSVSESTTFKTQLELIKTSQDLSHAVAKIFYACDKGVAMGVLDPTSEEKFDLENTEECYIEVPAISMRVKVKRLILNAAGKVERMTALPKEKITLKNGSIEGGAIISFSPEKPEAVQARLWDQDVAQVTHMGTLLKSIHEVNIENGRMINALPYDSRIHTQRQTVCYYVGSGPCKWLQDRADRRHARLVEKNELQRIYFND